MDVKIPSGDRTTHGPNTIFVLNYGLQKTSGRPWDYANTNLHAMKTPQYQQEN